MGSFGRYVNLSKDSFVISWKAFIFEADVTSPRQSEENYCPF